MTEDGELKEKYCPICKNNKKHSKNVKVGNTFTTEYYWKQVLVEIKEIC